MYSHYSMFIHMRWKNLNSITLLKIASLNRQMISAFNIERVRARPLQVLGFIALIFMSVWLVIAFQ